MLIIKILLIAYVFTKCLPEEPKQQVYSPNATRKASQNAASVKPSMPTDMVKIVTPPQNVAPPTPPGKGDWGLECLIEHNLRRASAETLDRKSLISLVWDQSLYQSAKSWADHLAALNNGLSHSKSGENLFSTTNRGSGCKAAVDAWFNEYPLYYNQKIGGAGFKGYGHFTQLLWPETRKIGCAHSDSSNARFIVCHYDPA